MTDGPGAQPSTTTLGVVDPIRIPGAAPAGAAWRRLPALGKVFVVLAVGDVVARALNVAGTSLAIDLSFPLSLVTAFVPHSLLILLPALLQARRPDAGTATPLIVRGAVVLALVELLIRPLSNVGLGFAGLDPVVAGMGVGIAATILNAAAWLALAIGLAAATSSRPGPALAGLANLVLATLVGSAIVSALALMVIIGPPDLGDPTWNAVSMVAGAMFSVEAVVFAYLAWIVVRGTNDARRPASARYLATGAFIVGAAIAAVLAVVGAVAIVQVVFALSTGPLGGDVALAWVGGWPVQAALLVAFALGLADASVRIPASERGPEFSPAPLSDPLSWPAPGGEVPTFRPVQPVQPAPSQSPQTRRVGRKSREPKS